MEGQGSSSALSHNSSMNIFLTFNNNLNFSLNLEFQSISIFVFHNDHSQFEDHLTYILVEA